MCEKSKQLSIQCKKLIQHKSLTLTNKQMRLTCPYRPQPKVSSAPASADKKVLIKETKHVQKKKKRVEIDVSIKGGKVRSQKLDKPCSSRFKYSPNYRQKPDRPCSRRFEYGTTYTAEPTFLNMKQKRKEKNFFA